MLSGKATGASFVGDRIKQFRETRKANKAEEEERQRRIVEQRKIEEEEFSVLRTQISNEEAISRANITSEEVAAQALARGITEQEVIDEQKNAIIRQAKIAKEAEDANKAREDEIESIKRSYGLDVSESPVSVPQSESPISDDRENITIPSPSPSENVQSLSTEEASAPSEISQITATKLDEVKEQLGENSPYLEEVVNLLKFLQDTSENPSPLDLENQREGNRESKIEQELEKKQIKLLEQIAENTGNLDEISDLSGGNIYHSLNVIARRANQIGVDLKKELNTKLNEFASTTDSLEEIHENKEQIEISKFYERLPNPSIIALNDFFDGKIYHRFKEDETEE